MFVHTMLLSQWYPQDGMTALHWACRRDQADIVMLLLNYGAYIDAEDAVSLLFEHTS